MPDAFEQTIFAFLKNDDNVRQYGYYNQSTTNKKIQAYTLIVDGEPSEKIDHKFSLRLIDACMNGPWMSKLRRLMQEPPHLLAMEVQMEGSVESGAWHVDSSDFTIWTVVVPLNDAYAYERGGCTEVQEGATTRRMEIPPNGFDIFDGSKVHRRSASTSTSWAKRRRVVFLHFADRKRPWYSLSGARRMHTKLKRRCMDDVRSREPDAKLSNRITDVG